MENQNIEKIYGVLLDLQKQFSGIFQEQGKHTGLLEGLDKKASYTNGKIASALEDINELKVRLSDYEEMKEGVKDVVTTKKAIIMNISSFILISGSVFFLAKYALRSYVKDIISESNVTLNDTGWK